MNLGTKEINRKTVHSFPANYVSLAQLKEKWMQKKEQEQREKEEQEELIQKQEVEERNRKQEEEQRKMRLGKDVQESENLYNRAKQDRSRKIPSPHHWNRRNVSGATFRVARPPCPDPVLEQVPTMEVKMHLKFASGLIEDDELKPGQPNQRKGKEIYTENRRNGNPIFEDCCKGNKKQSQRECKGDKTAASVAPETFKNGSESVKHEFCLNSNARNVDMEVKGDLKISTLKIDHPKQWKEKIYTEKRTNENPKSKDGHKKNRHKQSQAEGQGAKTFASVAPGTFKNKREGVEHEICRHSNVTTVDNPPPESLALRFENLSMKGNASRFFNRPKRENPKFSKLVWVRKEDVSSNNDLNGAQSSYQLLLPVE